MEVEMFVGYVVVVAINFNFDGVGFRAPFIDRGGKYLKAEWVRKT